MHTYIHIYIGSIGKFCPIILTYLFLKMEITRREVRSIMYYCWMRNLNGSKMSKEINEALGQNTVNERTCRRWIEQSNAGDFNLEDKERSGRPSTDMDLGCWNRRILANLSESR